MANNVSLHAKADRAERFAKIDKELGYSPSILDEHVIDRGHKHGPEKHVIDSRGVITIYNLNSGKLVTKLIARPGQIARYYKGAYKPVWYNALIKVARENTEKGANEW